MFNNPLNSFHDIVADAKEEREQLDRLLTISTPRERLLVAVIAVVLCILLGGLFFGNVARSLVVDGVLAEHGEHMTEISRTVPAFIWAEREIASHIEGGMPAMIETDMADGVKGEHGGTIRSISDIPISGDLGAFVPEAPVFVHRVDIALDENLDLSTLADRKCRIVIEIGRQAPISLFLTRRP